MGVFLRVVMKFFPFLFLLFFQNISAEVFIPTEEPDLSGFPPFIKNLAKDEKEKEQEEEVTAFKDVMQKVVNADDKQLEKTADELLKNQKKLNSVLSVFGDGIKKEFVVVDVPKEIQPILDEQYNIDNLINTKMSLDVKESDVRQIIELIAKTTGLNFVLDPDVSGIVSGIHLNDVSAAIVLRFLLSNNNPQLTLIRDFDVLRIVKLDRAIQILKGRLNDQLQKELIPEFFVLKNTKLTPEVKQHIEKMWIGLVGKIKDEYGAYLVFDDATKKVFFRGKIYQVEPFKKFLKEIDERIAQVKIEARIVLAKKDFEDSIGFDWSGLYDRRSTIGRGWNWFGLGNVNQDTGGTVPQNNIINWALNFFPTTWASKGSFSFPFIWGNKDLDQRRLNLKLNAAENKSEIKTLLKPTLLVNSDEPAEILVGKEVPIQTIITDFTEAKMRNMETVNYKELGMKLKVKPVVSPDFKSVFLDIYVEYSSILDGDVKSFDYKTSQIMTTKSNNKVLLKSGQTTLIGGLITNQKVSDKRGIPYLQRIPVLGLLFGSHRKVTEDEQLLIFITPTVV
ncbi:MAG: hypothetical protein ABIA74_05245 [bacterium]